MNLVSRATFALLVVLVFGSAVGVVWARHQTRSQFVQLQQLNAERDALDVQWGQLKLEQSAFATHGRVEQAARDDLKMIIPRPEEVRIVKP
jgi:cell division protein FtsL